MTNTVMVVDVSGRPTGLIPWTDAVRLIYQEKVNVIATEDGFWNSPTTSIAKPVIVQLPTYVKLKPIKGNAVPKRILWLRDGKKCGYCGIKLALKDVTKDHILSRWHHKKQGLSADKLNDWTNVISSCRACNHAKGNKTCAQWGTYPKITPKVPTYIQVEWYGVTHPIHKQWVEMYFKVDFDTLKVTEIPANEIE